MLPHSQAAPAAAASAAAAPLQPLLVAADGQRGVGTLLLDIRFDLLACLAAGPQRRRLWVGKERRALCCVPSRARRGLLNVRNTIAPHDVSLGSAM